MTWILPTIAVSLALALSGCSTHAHPQDEPYSSYSDQDISSAVCSILNPKIGYHFINSEREADDNLERIKALGPWVEAIESERLRSAYRHWLEFYRNGTNDRKRSIAAENLIRRIPRPAGWE